MLMPLQAAAAESTPQAAVAALWRASSNAPGGSADSATLRRLFHPEAVVFGGRYKDGQPALKRSSGEAFLKNFEQPSDKGFYECEVVRTVHTYDRFATAYSVVESRADPTAAKPDFVGVNSVQLYREGDQWRVLSLYYHVEKPGLAIDLGGGQPGKCLE
ncbi:nuclear transport factor 2 family protein [Lysobacter silvisoli]|uniref:Nuclear transport factor 2 family protein n=1 Tax=Lysobacter silvisoli TaxID=2293254 RepID=A0A371JWZ4_9GAMM|nr:nuclear transport factor 2 family protein [Lysobacter silvisoli]